MKFLCCVQNINGKFFGREGIPISDVKSIRHLYEVHFADEGEPVGDVWRLLLRSGGGEFLATEIRAVEIVDSQKVLKTIKQKRLLAEQWNEEFNQFRPVRKDATP